MYRHCIFCSADLRANEAVEAFPVGRTLAFDAAKGRLWAVCGKCARWNLAPLEERWEAVDAAERLFADARLRVQRENIGMAKLRDGSRLVRVGRALPGELAAWRYGDEFARRRRWHLATRAAGVGGFLAVCGLTLTGVAIPLMPFFQLSGYVRDGVRQRRRVHRVRPPGAGREIVIQRRHLEGMWMAEGDGELELRLPAAPGANHGDPLVVRGDAAGRLLARAMPVVNEGGAKRPVVDHALRMIEEAGSAGALVRRAAAATIAVVPPRPQSKHVSFRLTRAGATDPPPPRRSPILSTVGALSLEMALNDEQERRALEGELVLLESAWREAEEIAAIADRLAGGDNRVEPAT